MRYSFLPRTKVLLFFIILFSLVLLAKLFYIQVVHSSVYSDKADRQYATPSENIFERGTIFFTRKDGTLVSAGMQTTGFKLTFVPAKIINIYEEIAHRLSKEQVDNISALKIPGVNIFKEKWRFYPGENLASHALGFVGYKGDALGGRYGLERQYDKTLARNK